MDCYPVLRLVSSGPLPKTQALIYTFGCRGPCMKAAIQQVLKTPVVEATGALAAANL